MASFVLESALNPLLNRHLLNRHLLGSVRPAAQPIRPIGRRAATAEWNVRLENGLNISKIYHKSGWLIGGLFFARLPSAAKINVGFCLQKIEQKPVIMAIDIIPELDVAGGIRPGGKVDQIYRYR